MPRSWALPILGRWETQGFKITNNDAGGALFGRVKFQKRRLLLFLFFLIDGFSFWSCFLLFFVCLQLQL